MGRWSRSPHSFPVPVSKPVGMAENSADGNAMVEDTEVPPPAAVSKNGRKAEGNSIFSWIFVLALLGVWTAVGVVWFDIVDYDTVVGTLAPYDVDGDGQL